MHVTVVGDGKVGHTLAENLALEGHDVVIVDRSEQVLHKTEDALDVLCVQGNGANAKTLLEAGISKSDVIIAATSGDETNMLCCLMGKRLGAKFSIARIRDPEYNESLALLQKELGIDMAINPERSTALEISRLLRFPFANSIESFAKGRVEMVEFRVHEGDMLIGHPLKTLKQKLHGIPQVLFCLVERGDRLLIPGGDFVIQAEDVVHVAADLVTITAFFRYLGKNSLRVKNVMLLGGGRISYYLAKIILPMGIHVTVVEINEAKAEALSALLPEATIILGDGTDQDLLEQEGILQTDAFVALCDRDEENLMTGLYALRLGVPKVVVKNNRVSYANLLNEMGLDSIISPKSITCDVILRYVRAHANSEGSRVEKLYRLVGGRAEALEFIAKGSDGYIGVPLKSLHLRKNTLVAVIVRQAKVIIPFGDDHIEAGDSVIVIACESGIDDLNEVIWR